MPTTSTPPGSWVSFFYYSSLSPSSFTGNGVSELFSFSNSGHDRYGCNTEKKGTLSPKKGWEGSERLLSLNTFLFSEHFSSIFRGKRVKELILIWWKTKISISSTLGTTKERGKWIPFFSMKRVSLQFPQNFEEKKALFGPEKGFPFFSFFSRIVTLMKCAPIKSPHCVTQFASFESKLPFLTPLFPTSFRAVLLFLPTDTTVISKSVLYL